MALDIITGVRIGATGLAEGACDDFGGIRELERTPKRTINFARSAAAGGAKTKARASEPEETIKIIGDKDDIAILAAVWGATTDGSTYIKSDGGAGVLPEKVIYIRGAELGVNGVATPMLYKAPKAVLVEQSPYKSTYQGEENLWEATFELLYDASEPVGQRFYSYTPAPTDTTAPTFSSISPADAATGVARAGNVDVTFSEALRKEDVNDANFVLVKDTDNSVVSGTTVAFQDAACQVVRIAYTGLSATTKYRVEVRKGIRDVVGNGMAAAVIKTFTTGS